MKEVLDTLVSYPTVTKDREANNAALGFVSEYLVERGLHVAQYNFNGFNSLVATTRPNAMESSVMLAFHLDVVPTAEGADCIPGQDGDNLTGRGMLDMKSGAAVDLVLIDELAKEGKLEDYDIAIAATTEEETGGYNGTERLLEYGYRTNVCHLPDGGQDFQIQTSSKGFTHLAVSMNGSSTHGSTPWLGDNAIYKSVQLAGAIHELFPDIYRMGPDTNTLSLNKVIGGSVVNMVAESALFEYDARFTTQEEMDRIRNGIGAICLEFGAELDIYSEGTPANFDLEDPMIAPFVEYLQEETGVKVTGSKTLGSSDARFFAKYGIPVISLYPTGGGHHSKNEWVSETALWQYKAALRKYLDEFAYRPLAASENKNGMTA